MNHIYVQLGNGKMIDVISDFSIDVAYDLFHSRVMYIQQLRNGINLPYARYGQDIETLLKTQPVRIFWIKERSNAKRDLMDQYIFGNFPFIRS